MSEFVTQFETEQGNKKYDFKSLGNFPTAKVGQFLKVTAVDENGNPTEWEMAEALKPDMSNLDEAADLSGLAETLGASKVVTGTYFGNESSTRTISLGFRPRAVLLINGVFGFITNNSELCGGLAVDGYDAFDAVVIVDDGFKVKYTGDTAGSYSMRVHTNRATTHAGKPVPFRYIAIA